MNRIQFSKNDIRRGIKIPDKLTPELGEMVGIVIGDGHTMFTSKTKKEYRVYISGSKKDFEKFLKPFVIPVFKKLFNIEPWIRFRRRGRVEVPWSMPSFEV